LLMGGVVGRLFREFAVTLSVAIAFSAFVSLTLTPMMCSRMLRPHAEQAVKIGRLQRASERFFDGMLAMYERGLRWVLRHRRLMQVVTVLTVVATVALFVVVPKGLFPQQDTGLIMGMAEAPQDVSFRTMYERQKAIIAVAQKDADIMHLVAFIGSGP